MEVLPSGGQQPNAPPKDLSHHDRLQALPVELIFQILGHLRPTGPATTSFSSASRPEVSHVYVESRSTLVSVGQTSKLLHQLGTRHLYRTVLLRDHKQLLYFFRTLAIRPDLRQLVRSLVWAGILSEDRVHAQRTRFLEAEMQAIAVGSWDKDINWPLGGPNNEDDAHLASLMGIQGAESVEGWRLLGAVLGMTLRLKGLFLLHSYVFSSSVARCPEHDAVCTLLSQSDQSRGAIEPVNAPVKDNPTAPHSNGGGGSSRRRFFLQELELLVIEPHEAPFAEMFSTTLTMQRLMRNSPVLLRIETKGSTAPKAPREVGEGARWGGTAVSRSVREVLHLRCALPPADVVEFPTAFPNLSSFEAEYNEIVPPLHQRQRRGHPVVGSLLGVANTLETLTVTSRSRGGWGNPPPLLGSLGGMRALKNLTAELGWLFGTRFPSLTQRNTGLLADLPPSLETLHLIDYWGLPDPPPASGWPRLRFLDDVCTTLYAGCCSTKLAGLRDITISSPIFRSDGTVKSSSRKNAEVDVVEDPLISLENFYSLFATVGVRFSCVKLDSEEYILPCRWANMDS
ncbi:hypothetical protein VTK73DRAFT_8456 [Phialemonium thermophilum]|uniref:F-box domain-containing protein n=1 Tax=Phialemonium thermophilum TaxID=223376 RepID=A0ABR3W8B1_9PEZI